MAAHRTTLVDASSKVWAKRVFASPRTVVLIVILLLLGLSAQAWAQQDTRRPSAEWSVIRKGAPDIELPSATESLDDGRFVEITAQAPPRAYEDVVLRGAIGHVPTSEGSCTIDDGRVKTTVVYAQGLPTTILRAHSEAHQELRTLTWNPEDVQLLKSRRETQVRGPASNRESDDWNTRNWSIETFTWDEFRRPHTYERSQAGGAYDAFECSWESLRGGSCDYRENLLANVTLNHRGEVIETEWRTRDEETPERSVVATWDGVLLERVIRRGAIGSVSERFRYNDDGDLEGFERRKRVSRGVQTLRWRLARDENNNVVRVERRCFGACAGMKIRKEFDIEYDPSLDNTFCGAWWDDGIDPTLNGW